MPVSTELAHTTTVIRSSSTHHYNSQAFNMNGATVNPAGSSGPSNSTTTNNAMPNPNIASKQGPPRMMMGPQMVGARPGGLLHPGYVPNIGKEEVISWFRTASSATRLDTLCALLEVCVPFEIRILGSVLEVLGKKELGQLREMADKANGVVVKGAPLETSRTALFASIKGKDDPPITSPAPHISNTSASSSANSSSLSASSKSTVVNNSQSHLNPNHSAKSATSHHPPLSSGSQDVTNRLVPAHKTEQLRTIPYEPPQLRQQVMARNHSTAAANPPQPQLVNGTTSAGSRSNCSSEDETDATSPTSKDLRVLEYESTRGKLIIYLALLKSTNQGAANVYYSLISQVDKTVGNVEWMERQSESVMEEVDLLYTLGIHHPAFTFEQRLMLSEILLKVRRELQRKKTQAFAQFYSSVQGYDPQHGQYYFQLPPPPPHLHPVASHEHLGTPPPQPPLQGPAGHPGMPMPQPPHMNYFQPTLAFPLYQTHAGVSTHPQHPSYVNAAPIMSNVHLGTTIRSTSPSNIPPLHLGKDAATVPSAIKVETIPPPLFEKIPPIPTETNPNQPSTHLSQNVRSDKLFCFNCGNYGHLGHACELISIQQMTHHQYRLNYEDNNNKQNKSN